MSFTESGGQRCRPRLLAGTALAGGVLMALMPGGALAACIATVAPDTIVCTTTVTTDTVNWDGVPTNPGQDRAYLYSTGNPMTATVVAGAALTGAGLEIAAFGGAPLTVSVDGTVSQTAPGIVGGNFGAVALSGDSAITYSGTGSVSTNQAATYAISASNTVSDITITQSAGLVQGGGIGAFAFGGAITVRTVGAQIGTAGSPVATGGIEAISTTAGVTIEAGSVYSQLDSVNAMGAGSGDVVVVATGTVASTSGVGIIAGTSGSGNITVVQTGSVTAGSDGIYVNHLGSGAVAVTVNGSISAGGTGVVLGGPSSTLMNNGSISGGTGISTMFGDHTIVNAGAFTGTAGSALQFGFGSNLFVMQGPNATLDGTAFGSGGGSDTFRFAGTGSNTFDVGQIGFGWSALQKTDLSTWTLTGTATTTAAVTVDGGTLAVNGSLASASSLTVNSGGTLGGIGIVGTTVIDGGTLAPGNSIGTLTVQGNLTFTTAATYLVEVSPTDADRINVTGMATLAGSVQARFAPGASVSRSRTILSADGGHSGRFAGLTTNLPDGFQPELSYTATDVLLNLTAALGARGTLNRNQQSVATTLNTFFNGGGALPPSFVTVFGLTGAPLASTLSQLSGEVRAAAPQAAFESMQLFLNLMLDPFVAGRSGGFGAGAPTSFAAVPNAPMPEEIQLAYAKAMPGAMPVKATPMAYEPRWSVWGGAYGGTSKVDGDAVVGSHTTDSRTGGFAAGADYRLARDTVVGFALAGGGTSWSLANGLGSGRSDTFQAGVYGSHRFGAAYLSAALAYAWHDATTTRSVAIGPETLQGRFEPHVLSGRVEGGYRFGWASFGVTPYAAAQVQSFRAPGYTETATAGPGTFALSYASQTDTATRTELGLWADHRQRVNADTELVLRGRAAWAHDFDTDRRVTPTFLALPGASFTVDGAAPSPDLALLSAVAELRMRNGLSLSAKFDGEFGSRSESYAATGTLRYAW